MCYVVNIVICLRLLTRFSSSEETNLSLYCIGRDRLDRKGAEWTPLDTLLRLESLIQDSFTKIASLVNYVNAVGNSNRSEATYSVFCF